MTKVIPEQGKINLIAIPDEQNSQMNAYQPKDLADSERQSKLGTSSTYVAKNSGHEFLPPMNYENDLVSKNMLSENDFTKWLSHIRKHISKDEASDRALREYFQLGFLIYYSWESNTGDTGKAVMEKRIQQAENTFEP